MTSGLPHVTSELVRRLEDAMDAAGVAVLESRISAGNPGGTVLERFDGVTASATPSRPELDFMNRIHGLRPQHAGLLDAVLAFYHRLGLRPWIELPPGSEQLAARLADAGARPLGSVAVLYGAAAPAAVAGPAVREIDPGEAQRFGELLLEGNGVPADVRASDAPGAAALAVRRDIRLYLARVDGVDAAAAILRMGEGIGSLAGASTVPRFRRRGCQQALIARRLEDAREAGCDLVASLTTFGSPSLRNLERAGLRIAYTRTVWRV